MRNQACFSISVLKQQDLHGEGNLPELQVQKVLFPNLVFLFSGTQFISPKQIRGRDISLT